MEGANEMSLDELKSKAIEDYFKIQRIERAKDRDEEIAIQKSELRAKLESFGVTIDSLEIK